VITKTIAGNIALSLGMIGALSIVRFRHPVKSALELIMYFDLITIGIATSVRTKWAIQLILVSIIVIVLVKLIQDISKRFGKSFYSVSFNEGVNTNVIEVISKNKSIFAEQSQNLSSFIFSKNDGQYIYRLSFNNKDELTKFKDKISKEKNIEKINIVYE